MRASAGGRNLALTEEGVRFAQWLLKKGRKCAYFRTSVGGWGKVDTVRTHPSWLEVIDIGAENTEIKTEGVP